MTSKRILTGVLVLGVVLAGRMLQGVAEKPEKTEKSSRVIIGTFDSRAIAFAYGSAHRAGRMPFLEYPKAIEFRQGFGTGDVSEYLGLIKDEIPKIAKETGVNVIVSKWDIEYYDPNAVTFVDVTEALIQPFKPAEKDLEIIRELKKKPPASEKEIREFEASGEEI